MDPPRAAAAGFAATVKAMLASPWPLRAPDSATQLLALTDHVQSRDVEIPTVPLPPPAGKLADERFADTWHLLSVVGAVTEVCDDVQAPNRLENSAMAGTSPRMGPRIRYSRRPACTPLAIGKTFLTRESPQLAVEVVLKPAVAQPKQLIDVQTQVIGTAVAIGRGSVAAPSSDGQFRIGLRSDGNGGWPCGLR